MKLYSSVALQSPDVLIPSSSIIFERWAVVACDQYTSQPDYWKEVEEFVGESPSTFHMVLPEAYLETPKEEMHSDQVFPTMQAYLSQSVFKKLNGFILVERKFDKRIRRGLLAAIDLEAYDFNRDSQSLVRATEGTIIDRLPPRIAIREKAELEIPHILVLIDDPKKTVIEPLIGQMDDESTVYDFDLMQGGGHIKGYLIDQKHDHQIVSALELLKKPEVQSEKYGVQADAPPLLYAMGDGNHSLATAKAIWEKNKDHLPEDHPSRFALVELVNIHNEGIEFEAIHRIIKQGDADLLNSCKRYFKNKIGITECENFSTMQSVIDATLSGIIQFGLFFDGNYFAIEIQSPEHTLSVGNLQSWLDHALSNKEIEAIDYIHGADIVHQLGMKCGSAGFYLQGMPKNALFKSVIRDGALPRKTFSMGEAHQKRFYLECRKIK